MRTQVRRMAGVFYTFLGHERLGAVGWSKSATGWNTAPMRRSVQDGPSNGGPMKHANIIGLAVICGLAWAPDTIAQGAAKKGGIDAQFKAMDANGDSRLSREEHAAGAKKMFDAMDRSKDGKVIAAEMDASYEKITGRKAAPGDMSAEEKIKAVDTNGDRILTAEEHAAGSRMMFGKMDTNKDGFLSRSEYEAGDARYLKRGNYPRED